jgi:steroid delta-isomerase-like uncharacterized protein
MEKDTIEANKKTARQFFEYFANGETKQIENLWGNGYKFHFPGTPQPLSKKESLQLIEGYIAGFPDINFSIEYQISEGDVVVTRFTGSGTHTGIFQGIPATNKKVKITGFATHKIVNGKIEEEWAEFDTLGMMQQIGAVHEMVAHHH